jgi:predicted acylesterase/phospholipase RssA
MNNKPRIGLALSGGGFRASLYHLGTIRCLEEKGIMDRVEVMSTVSGGSIIGAYYLVEMEKKLRVKCGRSRLELCDEIIDEFCDKLTLNFRMRGLVFYPFYHPIMTLLSLIRIAHRGDTMAKAFEKKLFAPKLRIGDLPVQVFRDSQHGLQFDVGTRILINTTSLITGRRVVFSRESDSGLDAQIEKSDPNDFNLSRVVGASSSVPGVFKPLRIGRELLADGGIVDNQGIESLLDYFELTHDGQNLLGESYRQPHGDNDENAVSGDVYLLISDGAGQFSVKSDGKATRAGSAARSMSVLQAANRRKILKILLGRLGNGLTGFAFTHLAMNLKGRVGIDDRRLPSEFIGPTAELRTDLDEFSRIERDALIYHGYTLMRSQIEKWCEPKWRAEWNDSKTAETVPAETETESDWDSTKRFTWPPPLIEVYSPTASRPSAARLWISKFLTFGRGPVLRDARRFPLLFLPLLAVFLILGGLLAAYSTCKHLCPRCKSGSVAEIVADKIGDVLCLSPFQQGGTYWSTVLLASQLLCIFLSFYIAMFFYFILKHKTRLSEYAEARKLKTFR